MFVETSIVTRAPGYIRHNKEMSYYFSLPMLYIYIALVVAVLSLVLLLWCVTIFLHRSTSDDQDLEKQSQSSYHQYQDHRQKDKDLEKQSPSSYHQYQDWRAVYWIPGLDPQKEKERKWTRANTVWQCL